MARFFDWERFLNQHGIPYATKGPNVGRDHIAVQCPFCGSSDQSHHMSIALNGDGWRCFRDYDHRGRSPVGLIARLLGCSYAHAKEIAGDPIHLPSSGDLLSSVKDTLGIDQPEEEEKSLEMPKEFRKFNGRVKVTMRPYVAYLREREFTTKNARNYDVRFCDEGPWKGRIIFPVYVNGRLVSWTGRTIYRNEDVRYKTLTVSSDSYTMAGPVRALNSLSENLLWYDFLRNTERQILILTEGPFDAFKLNVIGGQLSVAATCFFTTSISDAQIDKLLDLLPEFTYCGLMQDQGAEGQALKTLSRLRTFFDVYHLKLPPDVDDPGSLQKKQLREILKELG